MRKFKLYEAFDRNTRKKYWWTQRDGNNDCYEIRKNETNSKYSIFVSEIKRQECETFAEAEAIIENLWDE